MALSIPQIVATYIEVWNETDFDRRMALLDKIWAKGGIYQDPTIEVTGREEFAKFIGSFQKMQPGVTLRQNGKPDSHHNHITFEWDMVVGPDRVAMKGYDFGTLDSDLRLRQIVGFFDTPPQ